MPVAFTAWMKYSGPIAPPTSEGLTPLLGPRPGALRSTFGAGPEGAAASGAKAEPEMFPLVSAVPPRSGELAVVFGPGDVLSVAGVATALCPATTAARAAAGNAAVSTQRRSAIRSVIRIVRQPLPRGLMPRRRPAPG